MKEIITVNNAYLEYMKQLKKEIPNTVKNESAFLYSVSLDIKDYLEDHPTASYDEIVSEFGSPKALGHSLIENIEPAQIESILLKQRKMKKLVCLLASTVLVVLVFLFLIVPHIAVKVNQEVYIYETESTEKEEIGY